MTQIDPKGFEAKFRADPDPWNYRASPFEAYKRRVLLRACGSQIHGRALELACAIGETTLRLASRCLRLLAVDASPTALEIARRRCRNVSRVAFRETLLPRETPRGPFDLIVMSELAYYLSPSELHRLLDRLPLELAPGGRIVVLHHLRRFDDAAQPPALSQARVVIRLGRTMSRVFHLRHAEFDVATFRKPRL